MCVCFFFVLFFARLDLLLFPMTVVRMLAPVCTDFRVMLRFVFALNCCDTHTHTDNAFCSVILFHSNENKHECRRWLFFFSLLKLLLFRSISLFVPCVFEAIRNIHSFVFRMRYIFRYVKSIFSMPYHFSFSLSHFHSLGNVSLSSKDSIIVRIKSFCLLDEHASFVTTSTSCTYDK